MTTLGFCSISALDRPLAAAARLAATAGCDALEVTDRPPHLEPGMSLAALREAGRAVRGAGVGVLAYGSYLGRMGPRELAHARREAEVAAALGAELLRVWAEPVAGAPDDGFRETARLLAAACDAAAELGVLVVVERHLGSFADTPERIARLCDAVDRPSFALNYQVLDLLPAAQAARQPDDARDLAGRARYFHLKNYRPGPQPGGPLLPGASLAAGALDYRAILAAAFAAGYAGPLTIEFLSFEPLPVEAKLAADVAFVRGLLRELGRAP